MTHASATTSCNSWRLSFVTVFLLLLFAHSFMLAEDPKSPAPNAYFKLGRPTRVLARHQQWEGNQFPHTLWSWR